MLMSMLPAGCDSLQLGQATSVKVCLTIGLCKLSGVLAQTAPVVYELSTTADLTCYLILQLPILPIGVPTISQGHPTIWLGKYQFNIMA